MSRLILQALKGCLVDDPYVQTRHANVPPGEQRLQLSFRLLLNYFYKSWRSILVLVVQLVTQWLIPCIIIAAYIPAMSRAEFAQGLCTFFLSGETYSLYIHVTSSVIIMLICIRSLCKLKYQITKTVLPLFLFCAIQCGHPDCIKDSSHCRPKIKGKQWTLNFECYLHHPGHQFDMKMWNQHLFV